MTRQVRVTMFKDFLATTKHEVAVTLEELAAQILSATAPAKNRLPWLKLASFGDKRTGKGSLRHDGNLLAISGIEADYDGGTVSFDTACEQLERARVEAIVYTSPSHSEAKSRWRILAPFSADLPPERRDQMMGRLNGLFDGIFAPESWTLSQSYYYGSVNQNPLHRVEVISGTPLDLHDDFDKGSIGKPGTIQRPKGGGDSIGRHRVGRLDADAMRRAIARGGSFHEACVRLLGRWAQEGVAFLEAQQRLISLFDEVPSDNRDGRWQSRRNDVPRLVRDIYGKHARQSDNAEGVAATAADATPPSFRDPWEAPPPLEWPGGVFHDELNDLVYQFHFRDGVDAGAQGMAMLTALSGAAPKNARFCPYDGSTWLVPPILWTMVVAESGQRKTPLITNAFAALLSLHAETWREHNAKMRSWRTMPAADRKKIPPSEEPHCLIVEDPTVESLQAVLAASPYDRGTCMLRDELAGLFGFGRYNNGHGDAERAFYLQAYEGSSHTVHRIKRGTIFISCAGLTIYGNIQPDRLSDFTGLESDGLLQRFNPIVCGPAGVARPNIRTPGNSAYDAALRRLSRLEGMRYATCEEGSALIRETERLGTEFANLADFGRGFQGYCSKLHGTHARIALILHLLDDPDEPSVPPATIERAGWLIRRFLLPQACDFYAAVPGSTALRTRDIAGWLLTKAPERFVASDLVAGIWACRQLSAKELNEALDPLVTGGWLEPEEPFPTNRAWRLHPMVRPHFAARAEAERALRAERRELFRRMRTAAA